MSNDWDDPHNENEVETMNNEDIQQIYHQVEHFNILIFIHLQFTVLDTHKHRGHISGGSALGRELVDDTACCCCLLQSK